MHYSCASGARTVQVARTAGARAWRQEHGWAAQNQRGQCDWSKRTGRGEAGVRLDETRGAFRPYGESRETWIMLR